MSLKGFSFGLSDYDNKTPGGNRIYNPGGYTNFSFTEINEELEGLNKWYFYKSFIIGEFSGGYFTIDETNKKIKTFKKIEDWNNEKSNLNLNPRVWTRWYFGDWIFYDDLLIILIFGFFISIPVLLATVWVFYQAIVIEHFNFKKPFSILTLLLITSGLFYTLLDLYPQSI